MQWRASWVEGGRGHISRPDTISRVVLCNMGASLMWHPKRSPLDSTPSSSGRGGRTPNLNACQKGGFNGMVCCCRRTGAPCWPVRRPYCCCLCCLSPGMAGCCEMAARFHHCAMSTASPASVFDWSGGFPKQLSRGQGSPNESGRSGTKPVCGPQDVQARRVEGSRDRVEQSGSRLAREPKPRRPHNRKPRHPTLPPVLTPIATRRQWSPRRSSTHWVSLSRLAVGTVSAVAAWHTS